MYVIHGSAVIRALVRKQIYHSLAPGKIYKSCCLKIPLLGHELYLGHGDLFITDFSFAINEQKKDPYLVSVDAELARFPG
jgi:hypothetical protein